MKFKKIMILGIVLVLVVALGVFVLSKANLTGNTINNSGNSNAVQKVTLGIQNYNYYPRVITVKVNEPVSITLDDSVRGCYRGFVINDFGVRKYSSSPSDTIDFTPTKVGTFRFSCTMGMGTGTLIVTETGTATPTQISSASSQNPASSSQGTCGGSGGGCGCGGAR